MRQAGARVWLALLLGGTGGLAGLFALTLTTLLILAQLMDRPFEPARLAYRMAPHLLAAGALGFVLHHAWRGLRGLAAPDARARSWLALAAAVTVASAVAWYAWAHVEWRLGASGSEMARGYAALGLLMYLAPGPLLAAAAALAPPKPPPEGPATEDRRSGLLPADELGHAGDAER